MDELLKALARLIDAIANEVGFIIFLLFALACFFMMPLIEMLVGKR